MHPTTKITPGVTFGSLSTALDVVTFIALPIQLVIQFLSDCRQSTKQSHENSELLF